MKKLTKQLLSLLLIAAMLLSMGAIVPITASAETYGDYQYVITEENEITITGYIGKDSELVIPSEIDGLPVTVIERLAFSNCTTLTSITIPDLVVSIDNHVFDFCLFLTNINVSIKNAEYSSIDGILFNKNQTNLIRYPCAKQDKSYIIPASVTDIDDGAFADCYSLTSITLPNSVKKIGQYAFSYCTSLKNITIPNSVKNMGYATFAGCINLTNVVLPDSLITIELSMFANCTSLKSVTIPNSVTEIKDNAFQHCESLTSIILPDSVTSIGIWAFLGCTNLKSVVLSNSLTNIGWDAFGGCKSLTSVVIPDSVTTIHEFVFGGCESLTSISVSEKNTKYSSIDGVLFNKDQSILMQYPAGKRNTTYTIPNSVETMSTRAFSDCISLTSVVISDYIKSIDSFTFHNCINLKDIAISDSVTNINPNAFENCKSLSNFTVSDKNTAYSSIDGVLFNKSKSTLLKYPCGKENKAYTILDSVTSISDSAFNDCINLTSIVIPDSVKNMGNGTFYNCTSLTNVVISNSVNSIGAFTFGNCSSLTSIIIPESVKNISTSTFENCSSLTSVAIPASVTSINGTSFKNCNKDLVIYGVEGSKAQSFAQNEGYTFKIYVDTQGIKVNLNLNGGKGESNLKVKLDGKIIKPQSPTKVGYIFAGWYKDKLYENIWNFEDDIVTEDVTIYAKWNELDSSVETVMTMKLNSATAILNSSEEISVDSTKPSETPFTLNGNTMVPVRLVENLGAEVIYETVGAPIIVNYNGIKLTLNINSNIMVKEIDGTETQIKMVESATFVEGKTYVPYRALCEALGFSVEYDESEYSIVVSTQKLSKEDLDSQVIISTKLPGVVNGLKSVSIKDDKATLNLKSGTSNAVTIGPDKYDDYVTYEWRDSTKGEGVKKLLFKSSDEAIVTVSSQGRIVGQKAGTATITISSHNGKTCTMEVVVQ